MYSFTKELTGTFDEAVERTRSVLKDHGMGVLTEIDMDRKFKEKLDVDFRRYKILGACSPKHAHKAVTHEPRIGLMLPCNVIVQELAPSRIEVSGVDPVASMQAIDNAELGSVATEVREIMKTVIDEL